MENSSREAANLPNWWYLWVNEEVMGPYTISELREHYRNGYLSDSTLVCVYGTTEWQALSSVPELLSLNTNTGIQAAGEVRDSVTASGQEEEIIEDEGMLYQFDREKQIYCFVGYNESWTYSADDWSYPYQKEDNPPYSWNVYVTGLPCNVKPDEIARVFSRCGSIKKDPETKEFCVEIYLDDTGKPKEALVRYMKEESVDLAIQWLDETPLRPDDEVLMSVTRAKFE